MAPKDNPKTQNPHLKRKNPQDESGSKTLQSSQQLTSRQRKYAKTRDARQVSVQTSGRAFGSGEVDLDKFVKAREFEIKALEDALVRSKKQLSARAFQGVPREMRRRTASHDVKKVPKRLRRRAMREEVEVDGYLQMEEDNTPGRTRRLTGKMRLRLDTAKKLREIRQSVAKRHQPKAKEAIVDIGDKKGVSGQMRESKVKKNKLQEPPKPQTMFRKRQIYKTWLPTHLYHTKRAHMTPPKEPLWRFALPLTPTNKSYRVTHRASGQRGAVAWDTSYMSTIGLEGPEKSVQGLLKALGVGANDDEEGAWAKKGERWRRGTRSWSCWLFEQAGWPAKPIGPAVIVWCLEQDRAKDIVMGGTKPHYDTTKHKRKALIRTHPSAFLQLWEQVIRLAKVQKPMVMVEDLRFEIGSIEVTGPASTEALLTTLWPKEISDDLSRTEDSVAKAWTSLARLGNPASTPPGALLAFEIHDPRLHFPARKADPPSQDSTAQFCALSLLSIWPPDRTQTVPSIFDRSARLKAQREMPSQKAIDRRKSLAIPSEYVEAKPSDPSVPIMLLANRTPLHSQGSWTLLLPWKCVNPVWNCLMHVPLSIGGSVRFGGQQEAQQVAFEAGESWFPGDFPGTRAGWEMEERERKNKKDEWGRKPKGKRVEWESVDLGNGKKGEIGIGWGCDWKRLTSRSGSTDQKDDSEGKEQQIQENGKNDTSLPTKAVDRRNTANEKTEKPEELADYPEIFHLCSSIAHATLYSPSPDPSLVTGALITVRLSILTRGVTTRCGRIYRLPNNDPTLRQKWLSLLPDSQSAEPKVKKNRKDLVPIAKTASQADVQKRLERILFEPMPVIPGSKDYPVVPDKGDLLGFVTSGSFNLREGRGTGIGSLLLSKVMEQRQAPKGEEYRGKAEKEENKNSRKGPRATKEDRICIVREAGLGCGRLAMWELC
ncbi:MAG: hypothetical protein M1821_005316 [Bathelium mastoideum]|nr:MAG: hypothetical protein M1821_005316 [Bathelium mastoideum]